MEKARAELLTVFREQQRFAAGYSPLYARLFDIVAGWLAADEPDPVVAWLVELAGARRPFDLTLLLPAALHREVLSGVAEALPLAAFFPTAGGGADEASPALADALRRVILARGPALAGFMRHANVQTNETGRGLAWLLPVTLLGWPAVHLVELGASAGLNLVAEQRRYRLAPAADPQRAILHLGLADSPQFTSLVHGELGLGVHAVGQPAPALTPPGVLSRAGGDVHPFHLRTQEDERTLSAFVWADQPQRLVRLREGIAALQTTAGSAAPVRLWPVRLPEELPRFLAEALPPALDAPVVIFNTVVTMYLPDGGLGLRRHVESWAGRQSVPVLWAQWEPPDAPQPAPPEYGWSAWSVDLWRDRTHRRFHLGWVHPHGTAVRDLDVTPFFRS